MCRRKSLCVREKEEEYVCERKREREKECLCERERECQRESVGVERVCAGEKRVHV